MTSFRLSLAALSLLLLPFGPAGEGQTVSQCREANTQIITTIKATLDNMPVRDREGPAALIADLER